MWWWLYWKVSVILLGKSLDKFSGDAYSPSTILFLQSPQNSFQYYHLKNGVLHGIGKLGMTWIYDGYHENLYKSFTLSPFCSDYLTGY